MLQAALLSALLAVPSTAGASSILFSQPYAGAAQGWVSDSGQPQFTADDFTLATPSVLTDFHWWGGYTNTPRPEDAPVDSFSLTFYSDLASLQSFTGGMAVSLTNLSRTSTGDFSPLGNAIFSYSADFVSGLVLGPGTYYALLVGHAGPRYFGWSTTAPNTGDLTWIRTSDGNWGQAQTGQAFEVTGNPVPEPTTLLLLGSGLAAVAARRRFMKRA